MKQERMHGSYILIDWLWNKMSFLKRRRVKFNVDLQVCSLSDVPLVNAVLFAKVRLLDGGTYEDTTERVDVKKHSASWTKRSCFSVRIASDLSTGVLEKCLCRISVRREQKGGKSYVKLGYVDINLSEFAGSGVEGVSRCFLLDGYGQNQRLDNSKVQVKITMTHQSADPVFRVPRIAAAPFDDMSLNPVDRRAPKADKEDGEMNYECHRNSGQDATECGSTAGSSGGGAGGGDECGSMTSSEIGWRSNPSTLRRLSQDRSSAPRIQNTRIDAGGIIDQMLAESRLSEEVNDDNDESREGLALKDVDKVAAGNMGMQLAGYMR